MRLRIKDTTYEVDESRITVAEAKTLKRNAGMTVFDFRNGLAKGDPDSAIFLMWLAKSREGERVSWSSFDDCDMVSDVEIILDDERDDEDKRGDGDEAAEGGADPTRDGSTRTGAATSTSRRSRSTSTSTRAKSTS